MIKYTKYQPQLVSRISFFHQQYGLGGWISWCFWNKCWNLHSLGVSWGKHVYSYVFLCDFPCMLHFWGCMSLGRGKSYYIRSLCTESIIWGPGDRNGNYQTNWRHVCFTFHCAFQGFNSIAWSIASSFRLWLFLWPCIMTVILWLFYYIVLLVYNIYPHIISYNVIMFYIILVIFLINICSRGSRSFTGGMRRFCVAKVNFKREFRCLSISTLSTGGHHKLGVEKRMKIWTLQKGICGWSLRLMFDNFRVSVFDSLFSDVILNQTRRVWSLSLFEDTPWIQTAVDAAIQPLSQVILIGPGRKLLEQDLRPVR